MEWRSNMKRIGAAPWAGLFLLAALPLWGGGGQETGPPFEERFRDMSWEEITAEAEGQSLYFYMWGGSDVINSWVGGFFADLLAVQYGITLEMVPITGAQVYINKVLSEKQAGKHRGGAVDLVWINGENFRTMRQGELLFGPYADKLPNMAYVNDEDPSFRFDFGYPVEGYESPYGAAQMVMIYDSAVVAEPPESLEEFLAWIKDNPGRFTYPALPDFTGSAFARHLFYYAASGTDRLMGPFDQEVFDQVAADFVALMNELEPFLWRSGSVYPEDITKMNELFANGEISFTFNYGPGDAAAKARAGKYPDTVRTFLFDTGTIGNINYLAIPYNSGAKAAAMVAANAMLSPEVQYSLAADRGEWPLAVDPERLPPSWREKIDGIERHPSVLSAGELASRRLPEMTADWLVAIEELWQRDVLEK